MTITHADFSASVTKQQQQRTTKAQRASARIDKLRARRRSREWEVRLSHEFIQTWARILHPQSFLLFTVLEMFADWRPGPNHGHTGGHQTVADLMALCGMDEKTVRRGLSELSFYHLISFPIEDWRDRRRHGRAVDIVVFQHTDAPKVLYRQQFQDVKQLDSICRRADIPPKWGEVHSPKWGEVHSPKWGEVHSPKCPVTTPQNGESQESIVLDSSHRDISSSSSIVQPTPHPTTTTTHPPTQNEAETLFKILPGYFDLKATSELINRCRNLHPDCTTHEIFQFVQSKLELIDKGRIKNPVGFLLTAVPESLRGWALVSYRQAVISAKLREQEQEAEWTRVIDTLSKSSPHGNNNGNSQDD